MHLWKLNNLKQTNSNLMNYNFNRLEWFLNNCSVYLNLFQMSSMFEITDLQSMYVWFI